MTSPLRPDLSPLNWQGGSWQNTQQRAGSKSEYDLFEIKLIGVEDMLCHGV